LSSRTPCSVVIASWFVDFQLDFEAVHGYRFQGASSFAFAIIPLCSGFSTIGASSGMNTITLSTTREAAEAITDTDTQFGWGDKPETGPVREARPTKRETRSPTIA
jgi:hypothetical protein